MSEIDTIAVIPPKVAVPQEAGIGHWRPIVERLIVVPRADGGCRLDVMGGDEAELLVIFLLEPAAVNHLIGLLAATIPPAPSEPEN
jgi:hypothetical protein